MTSVARHAVNLSPQHYHQDDDKYKDPRRPRKINFFVNGDRYFKGKKMFVTPYRYYNFNDLLNEVTGKLPANLNLPYGVRQIYDKSGGQRITDVDDLIDGDSYVLAGFEGYKAIKYGSTDMELWSMSKPVKSSNQELGGDLGKYRGYANNAFAPGRYFRTNGSYSTKNWPGKQGASSQNFSTSEIYGASKPKVITVVRNGAPARNNVKILLNRRSVQSYEQLISDISEAFTAKGRNHQVHKLYTIHGKVVQSVSDFFRNDDVFIGVGQESFSDNEVRTIVQELYNDERQVKSIMRSWEKHQKRRHAKELETQPKTDKRDSGFAEPSDNSYRDSDSNINEHTSRTNKDTAADVFSSHEKGRFREAKLRRRQQKLRESEQKALKEEKRKKGLLPLEPIKDPYKAREEAKRRRKEESKRLIEQAEEQRHKEQEMQLEREQEERRLKLEEKEQRMKAEKAARKRKEAAERAEKMEREAKERALKEKEQEVIEQESEELPVSPEQDITRQDVDRTQSEKEGERSQSRKDKEPSLSKNDLERSQSRKDTEHSQSRKKSNSDLVNNDTEKDDIVQNQNDKQISNNEKPENDTIEIKEKSVDHQNITKIENQDNEKLKEKTKDKENERPKRKSKAKVVRKTKLERQVSKDEHVTAKYELGRVLGDGNFAVVKQSRIRSTGQEFGIKVIDKSKLKGKEHMVENEIEIMKECNHFNIVKLYEEYETKDKLYLVMELVKGGDLFDAITQSVKFNEMDASRMVKDLCNALFYLHSRNIVHRDLKPENLLVHRNKDSSISLKLADFGLALEVQDLLYTVCGTPTYVAPEILSEIGYSLEVDMWAVGVIMYILLCGFPPFRSPDRKQTELFALIKAGDFEFVSPYWDGTSSYAKNLINHLLVVDRAKRYSSIDVLCHPWIMYNGDSKKFPENIVIEKERREKVHEMEKEAMTNFESYQKAKERRL